MKKGIRLFAAVCLLLSACWVSAYLAEWEPLETMLVPPAYVFGLQAFCVAFLVLLAGVCCGGLFYRDYGHVAVQLVVFVMLLVLYAGLPFLASSGFVPGEATAAVLLRLLTFVSETLMLLYVTAFFTGLSLGSRRHVVQE